MIFDYIICNFCLMLVRHFYVSVLWDRKMSHISETDNSKKNTPNNDIECILYKEFLKFFTISTNIFEIFSIFFFKTFFFNKFLCVS